MPILYPADVVMMEQVNRLGQSDLLFTLTESAVALPQQWRLIDLGYCTLRRFSGIEDSRAAVRQAMVLDLELDPLAVGAAGQEARLGLSAVVTAWETAKAKLEKETQMRVEAKVLGITRQIDSLDRTSMNRAVETLFGPVPLHESPSADYLSHMMEQLEDGDVRASALDEVSSMTDTDLSATVPGWDNAGRSQLFRKRAKGVLPLNPEAFRTRLRVERNMWLFVATKFTNRPFLVGLTPQIWDEWILIEIMRGDGGKQPLNPPWNIILGYELECRKNALLHVVDDGITLAAAMKLAIKDPELKELAFTSPIAHLGRKGGPAQQVTASGHPNLQNPNWPLKKNRTGGPYAKSGGGKGSAGAGSSGSGKSKGKGGRKGGGKGQQGQGKEHVQGDTRWSPNLLRL